MGVRHVFVLFGGSDALSERRGELGDTGLARRPGQKLVGRRAATDDRARDAEKELRRRGLAATSAARRMGEGELGVEGRAGRGRYGAAHRNSQAIQAIPNQTAAAQIREIIAHHASRRSSRVVGGGFGGSV
jgi:hypothetical protein